MKKLALAVLIAAVAASSAMAQSKKMLTPKEAMEANQKSWDIVVRGMPLILPSWAQVIYFTTIYKDPEAKKKKKRK